MGPACLPSVPPDQLGFDGFEKGFQRRIIVANFFGAHRGFDAVHAPKLLVIVQTTGLHDPSDGCRLWVVLSELSPSLTHGLQCRASSRAVIMG